MSPFLETLRREIRRRGYSMRTEKPIYIGFASLFSSLRSAILVTLARLKLTLFNLSSC